MDGLNSVWRRIWYAPWRLTELRPRYRAGNFGRLCAAVRPYTGLRPQRLYALYDAVRRAEAAGIVGDVVECGSARGGSAALLGLTLNELGSNRKLWVFDTFEGLPPPTAEDPASAASRVGDLKGDIHEIEALFRRFGIMGRTHLVKGLFQQTLPTTTVGRIAVLHLDGDWYESIKVCLQYLYDRVSPGGVVQLDDYGKWPGARRALHEFMDERRIALDLRKVDLFRPAVQFTKP